MQAQSASRHLLLIGGGHSHLYVLKHFATLQKRRPTPPGFPIRITLLSKHSHALYSGMLPGVIAGHYHPEQTKIDLKKLCERCDIDFIADTFTALDTEQQLVHCASGRRLAYDWLSLNLGSQPDLSSIEGADQVGFAVKPIDQLLSQWQQAFARLSRWKNPHICLVGGGAASVEVTLALYQALQQHHLPAKLSLVCATPTLLPSHHLRVQRQIVHQLQRRAIRLHCGHRVIAAQGQPGDYRLELDNQRALPCSEVIWAVQAAGQPWLQDSGLACTDAGFIRVNQHLQSVSHPNVFAAGDLAHFVPQPLAKSGVHAVRQGQPLADNLQRIISGQRLSEFKPQRHFLSLLALGNQRAIASRGNLCLRGRWVWWWKDIIDRRFIRQFEEFEG